MASTEESRKEMSEKLQTINADLLQIKELKNSNDSMNNCLLKIEDEVAMMKSSSISACDLNILNELQVEMDSVKALAAKNNTTKGGIDRLRKELSSLQSLLDNVDDSTGVEDKNGPKSDSKAKFPEFEEHAIIINEIKVSKLLFFYSPSLYN